MDDRSGFGRAERLNRVVSLWNRTLSECVVSVLGANAPYIWMEVGRLAVERLKEEGVDIIKDDPVDTINAVYSYFTENGYFHEARARRAEGSTDIIEIRERWSVDFDLFCVPPYEDDLGAHACFCYHIIRYSISSAFALDLRFIDYGVNKDSKEVLIRASLVPSSTMVLEASRFFKELERRDAEIKKTGGVFRRAIEMSLDAIVSADESGRVILWNLAAERIMGYPRVEAIGMPLETLIPLEYRERHREGFRMFLKTGTGALIGKVSEIEGLRRDGTRFPLEMSLTAEKNSGRWVFMAVIRDISYRKDLEDRLKVKLCEMERLNKLMVGRELKMEELRAEIRTLRSKAAGQNDRS